MHLFKNKNRIFSRFSKTVATLLILAWVFSGWPQLRFDIGQFSFEFPPETEKAYATVETFTTAISSTTWTAPANVSTVTVECWGGGGGGGGDGSNNNIGSGGGGGGAYALKEIAVTAGNSYTYTVGAVGAGGGGGSGSDGAKGGSSVFLGDSAVYCVSEGGFGGAQAATGGAGGTTANSDGTTEYAGGAGFTSASTSGGGGGGSGGTGSAGTTATSITGATAVTGGGPGGNGGTDGNDGNAPASGPGGGGGGSGDRSGGSENGGAGFAGQIRLTYTAVAPVVVTDFATSTPGRIGGALDFDGDDDYIVATDSASISPTSAITVSSWFAPDDTISGTADYIQGLLDNGTVNLFLDRADGKLKYTLNSATAESWGNLDEDLGDGSASSTVYALAVYKGKLYVGGLFKDMDGIAAADHIATWDGSVWGNVDDDGAGEGSLVSTGSGVKAFAVYQDKLYVGGQFTDADGIVTADRIATWDGSVWGNVDENGGNGSLGNNIVEALAVYQDKLYVGGSFTNADGIATADYIATWDGSAWGNVDDNGAGDGSLTGTVFALAVYQDKLYVGGGFDDADGIATADNIATWDGTSWGNVDELSGNGSLGSGTRVLAVYQDKLYVGGGSVNIDGIATADYIATWDGSVWGNVDELSGNGSLGSAIRSLAVYQGKLYVGGLFSNADGIATADRIATWDGSAWGNVDDNGAGDGSLADTVQALAVYEGKLYVGGNFTNADGIATADYIASWGSGDDVEIASTKTSWPREEWHHSALTYDGTTVRIYIDGVQEASTASTISLVDPAEDLYVGTLLGSPMAGIGETHFDGKIDDFRMYNKALSADEITRLYKLGATTKIATTLNTQPDLERGLVGHWTFDGKDVNIATNVIVDRAGGNNGSTVGMNTSTTTAPGRIGQAMEFDGSDDYVDTNTPISSLFSASEKTISVWVKPEGIPPNGFNMWNNDGIVTDSNAYMGIHRGIRNSDGLWAYNWDGSEDVVGVAYTTGAWTHLVYVHTGGTLYLYKDGVLGGSTASGDTQDLTNNLTIGVGGLDDTPDHFEGKIDDVRVYNRALSADEITRLYKLGATTKIATTLNTQPDLERGLTGHWTLDGKDVNIATNVVTDRSGQGNNGSTVGMNTSTTTAPGRIGQAFDFDGTDDYVNTGVVASSFFSASEKTISVWMKPIGTPQTGSSPWHIDGVVADFSAYLGIHRGSLLGSDFIWAYNYDGTEDKVGVSYTTGEWAHIVYVHSGGTLYIYKNGVLGGSTASGNTSVMTNNIVIGAGGLDASADYFEGTIDDVRVYNRALSADEITQLYKLGQ